MSPALTSYSDKITDDSARLVMYYTPDPRFSPDLFPCSLEEEGEAGWLRFYHQVCVVLYSNDCAARRAGAVAAARGCCHGRYATLFYHFLMKLSAPPISDLAAQRAKQMSIISRLLFSFLSGSRLLIL